jgi:hypothetical protein
MWTTERRFEPHYEFNYDKTMFIDSRGWVRVVCGSWF